MPFYRNVCNATPCGRLSWLPVSFLLHVKYTPTLSYRIVTVDIDAINVQNEMLQELISRLDSRTLRAVNVLGFTL